MMSSRFALCLLISTVFSFVRAEEPPLRWLQLPNSQMEVDGLPCRPCDQRVCEPGDFRCLTRIEAPRVIAAAERALQTGGERSSRVRQERA